jgi:hypothetical protein
MITEKITSAKRAAKNVLKKLLIEKKFQSSKNRGYLTPSLADLK